MTTDELQLVKQVLETAGSVGSQGFEAMVRYTFASGLAWLIGGCLLFVCSALAIVVCFVKGEKWSEGGSDAVACVFMGSCIIGVISLFMIVSNIVDVIEPQGTTVKMIVDRAAKK